MAEGFAQRCSALARLDSLPPIAPDAVRTLAATHRPQLLALLADGPALADPLAAAQGIDHGRLGAAAAAQELGSSLDWQVAAAARRSPTGSAPVGDDSASPASAVAASQPAAPVTTGQAGGRAQASAPGVEGGNILDSLEV